MATYHIEPNEQTLQNCFSRDIPPVLTIASGDTVIFKTLDAAWGIEAPTPQNVGKRKKFPRPTQYYDGWGHALCGPVAIAGAQAGMTLEIQIGKIIPGTFGFNSAGGSDNKVNVALGLETGEERVLLWQLNAETGIAENQHGHCLKMRPFMGVMGVAPAEEGAHSTIPPRNWGGNLDCKELVAGTSLFLPVGVERALFSVGDGHGVQGDGEVCYQGIECPMEHIELTFVVHPEMNIQTPRARLANGWITLGFDEDLEQATFKALDAMLDIMVERYNCHRKDALALASLVVDMRVTQIANETLGVHAFLPDDALL